MNQKVASSLVTSTLTVKVGEDTVRIKGPIELERVEVSKNLRQKPDETEAFKLAPDLGGSPKYKCLGTIEELP